MGFRSLMVSVTWGGMPLFHLYPCFRLLNQVLKLLIRNKVPVLVFLAVHFADIAEKGTFYIETYYAKFQKNTSENVSKAPL